MAVFFGAAEDSKSRVNTFAGRLWSHVGLAARSRHGDKANRAPQSFALQAAQEPHPGLFGGLLEDGIDVDAKRFRG